MPEENATLQPVHTPMKPWYRRQLIAFIGGSIVIALVLVMLSMALYTSSGAAQLDLSRPGYKSVQSKVQQTGSFESFPASGPVDKQTLEQFQKLYAKQVKLIQGDAFNASALDDQVLGIEAPSAGE